MVSATMDAHKAGRVLEFGEWYDALPDRYKGRDTEEGRELMDAIEYAVDVLWKLETGDLEPVEYGL